jgi:hypothetical protein
MRWGKVVPECPASAPQAHRGSAGLAVAIVAMLSQAICAQNGPAPGTVTVSGPHFAGAQATSSPSPREPVGPAAVNPLSERAQRIKKGFATPAAPGANPVPGAPPPDQRRGPGPSGNFNGDHPLRSRYAGATHPVLEADLGPLFFNARFSRGADWLLNEPFPSDG